MSWFVTTNCLTSRRHVLLPPPKTTVLRLSGYGISVMLARPKISLPAMNVVAQPLLVLARFGPPTELRKGQPHVVLEPEFMRDCWTGAGPRSHNDNYANLYSLPPLSLHGSFHPRTTGRSKPLGAPPILISSLPPTTTEPSLCTLSIHIYYAPLPDRLHGTRPGKSE